MRLLKFLAPLCVLLAAGCAGVDSSPAQNDPFESLNRPLFRANTFLDHHVLAPVARAYSANVPEPVRAGVHNFVGNLDAPVTLANDLLQGDFTRAWDTTKRFGINSTVGILGINDVAAAHGVPGHDNDAGLTLGIHGMAPGPYLVLPLMGPSDLRDTAGTAADTFFNPLNYVHGASALRFSVTGLSAIDARARNIGATDELERSSIDLYAAERSAFGQYRANELHQLDGTPTPLPDMSDSDSAPLKPCCIAP